MNDRKQTIRNRIVIMFSGILTLTPLIYWCLTEGQKPMYEESVFFPHYFIMLAISIVIAVINCFINRKIVKAKFLCVMECTIGGLIVFAFAAVMLIGNASWEDGFFASVIPFCFSGALVGVYVLIQLMIHGIIELLLSKVFKRFFALVLGICMVLVLFTGNVFVVKAAEAEEKYVTENPLLETTPYYKKYMFPGMGEEKTIVTVGFYEGINELFLKISG